MNKRTLMTAVHEPFLRLARCLGLGFLLVELIGLAGASPADAAGGAGNGAEVIAVAKDASPLERLAAGEVRRYVFLRSGKLLPVEAVQPRGGAVIVTVKNTPLCGDWGRDLAPQQFRLKTVQTEGRNTWWIIGGDEVGALYGAYRFAEKLGVRFGLDEDALPDEPLTGAWPSLDETAKPRFALRGLQPFHDFSVGPDWWNLHDYQSVLQQMAKLRMNFIGFHTYPSWNPGVGPEANVWIGLPEDVDEKGDVKAAYEAGVVTTRRGWNVVASKTGNYASGASLLFEQDDYGPDFMLDCLDWPKTQEAAVAMFNRYGNMQQQAFSLARRFGIKTAIGTEVSLGIPGMLEERLKAKGLKANDPEVTRQLYEGTFLRIKRKMPVDYYWLWLPEAWLNQAPGSGGWQMASTDNSVRDFNIVDAAAKAVQAPFGLGTCGWRLGSRGDALWTDKVTPKSWAISSINVNLGRYPVEKHYGEITGRPKWAIGWAEDDDSPGGNCCTCLDLQLWVKRMFRDSADAFKYGCDGMMAIHWRTAAMSPNMAALSQAGWSFEQPGIDTNASILLTSADTREKPVAAALDAYWADWGRGLFGGDAGAEAGRLLQKFDEAHLAINHHLYRIDEAHLAKNQLYSTNVSDEQIARIFVPLGQMESLRPRIQGAAALARYDYWLDSVRATRARAETSLLANRLAGKLKEAAAMTDANARRQFAREQLLPLRLAVARRYEQTIAHYVNAAKSMGEVGAITHIEYGSRQKMVTSQDKKLEALLGAPLPPESAVSGAYRGKPRIFLSSSRTQMNAGEPQELRPFVLSSAKCVGVNLQWRVLGEGVFQKVAATQRNRQAYRVSLPAQSGGTVEYYLEAMLEDGSKVLWPASAPKINQTVIAW